LRIWASVETLHHEEGGQDLVEYALVAVIIALAATAGMSSVAKEINAVFSSVAKKIAGYGV
jgi:pilus assembly protein Flp/PilA